MRFTEYMAYYGEETKKQDPQDLEILFMDYANRHNAELPPSPSGFRGL